MTTILTLDRYLSPFAFDGLLPLYLSCLERTEFIRSPMILKSAATDLYSLLAIDDYAGSVYLMLFSMLSVRVLIYIDVTIKQVSNGFLTC